MFVWCDQTNMLYFNAMIKVSKKKTFQLFSKKLFTFATQNNLSSEGVVIWMLFEKSHMSYVFMYLFSIA